MNAGIYIHIPFCVKKCNYCAFLSEPSTSEQRAEYVDALVREIELRAKENRGREYDTIYLGGGTPSVLTPEQIDRILNAVRENYKICEGAEITLEANPGTLGGSDEEVLTRLSSYRAMGINRLSMGVQSMNDERLKFLGRIHDSETVKRDFKLARQAGFDNINLDIIFSVPGESLEEALWDIEEIAGLGPEHISFYSLQIEEGTKFYELWKDKKFDEVDDEIDRQTFHKGAGRLGELGYEHYEISNFAKATLRSGRVGEDRPNARASSAAPRFGNLECGASQFRSRHNSKYWAMADYLAFGLGASGFVSDGEGRRVRYRNLSERPAYIGAVMRGERPTDESHVNDEHDNISETIFTGLRRREGVRYDACFGHTNSANALGETAQVKFWKYFAEIREEAEDFVRSGHLVIDSDGIRLTEAGLDISNKIMSLFV